MSGNWNVDGNDQHLYGQTVSSFISPVAQQLPVASWITVPQNISQVPVTYEVQGSGLQSLSANPTYGIDISDGWFRPSPTYSRYWLNTPSRFQAHGKWALHIPNIFAGVSQPVLIGSSVGAALTVVMVVSLATGLTIGLKPSGTEETIKVVTDVSEVTTAAGTDTDTEPIATETTVANEETTTAVITTAATETDTEPIATETTVANEETTTAEITTAATETDTEPTTTETTVANEETLPP